MSSGSRGLVAEVWAIMAGAAVPVSRGGPDRLSVRFGTEIVLHGRAVEPAAAGLAQMALWNPVCNGGTMGEAQSAWIQ